MRTNIYQYIVQEEAAFSGEIQIGENWFFNFKNHVQMIFHLANGLFFTGANNWMRAFKNIMEPILNLSFWAEDIELKDVVFYIENSNGRVLSFFVKKFFNEVYVKKVNLDTLFDELTESDLTFGGALVQKTNGTPEVLPMQAIAFCDQTDIMGGPIGFKYNFSPDTLRKMTSRGWGDKKNGADGTIEELITLAGAEKKTVPYGSHNKTTGKNIEVYVIRGSLPEHYLKDNDNMEDYYNQLHIVALYKKVKGQEKGVILYRKKETQDTIKFFTSKKVYGRALGRGVGETLLHPQVWTNFLEIHKVNMLAAASKVPLYTDDPNYQNRNKIQDMENLEITTIDSNSKYGIRQVPTAAPANIQLFEREINEWYEQAQLGGAAFDPLLGKEPPSGTTFRGQERSVAQGRGLHERRRGQRAKFIEEILRDWVLPDITKEILKGKEFLATLDSEELSWVTEQLAENYANKNQIEDILNGVQPRDKELLRQEFLTDFTKKGNKHLIAILEKEFKDIEIKIGINVAGKNKNLADMSDKILSIFQFVFTNPVAFTQAMQIPALSKAFGSILEYSGLSIADFSTLTNKPVSVPQISESQPKFIEKETKQNSLTMV